MSSDTWGFRLQAEGTARAVTLGQKPVWGSLCTTYLCTTPLPFIHLCISSSLDCQYRQLPSLALWKINPIVYFLSAVLKCSLMLAENVHSEVRPFTLILWIISWWMLWPLLKCSCCPPDIFVSPEAIPAWWGRQKYLWNTYSSDSWEGAQDLRSVHCLMRKEEVLMTSVQIHSKLAFCFTTLREQMELLELRDRQESRDPQ